MSDNKNEFEPDRICEDADGCPTEGAVLKRFWRAHQPDKSLLDFYSANDYPSLVRELVGHVTQLQDAARRNVKPWEDTMPPTLLPAYVAQLQKADDELRAVLAQEAGTIKPFAWVELRDEGGPWEDSYTQSYLGGNPKYIPLYASPQAPASVVLPERKATTNPDPYDIQIVENDGWNACLDKLKELNQ